MTCKWQPKLNHFPKYLKTWIEDEKKKGISIEYTITEAIKRYFQEVTCYDDWADIEQTKEL